MDLRPSPPERDGDYPGDDEACASDADGADLFAQHQYTQQRREYDARLAQRDDVGDVAQAHRRQHDRVGRHREDAAEQHRAAVEAPLVQHAVAALQQHVGGQPEGHQREDAVDVDERVDVADAHLVDQRVGRDRATGQQGEHETAPAGRYLGRYPAPRPDDADAEQAQQDQADTHNR